MGQTGPPGDVEFTSSKGLLGHDKEMHRSKQDPENGNAGESACFLERNTSSGCKDGFEQEIHRNVIDLDDAEDVVVSGDSNGCLNERTDIATKKLAFLSSQCSFIQGSVDCKDLNVCVKCNKGGELKVCSSTNSCRLVVHESCSDSHMSFSTRGEFQCPFCAYSQALSEYMYIKKKVSLTQKDFVTFVCLEARKELKKQPCRSYRSKQHRSEHNDSVYISIDPNNQDNSKHINNQKRRRKLEFQEAGCSTLSSGDHSPSRGETVDATKGENASGRQRTEEKVHESSKAQKGIHISRHSPIKAEKGLVDSCRRREIEGGNAYILYSSRL
ncbi:uncharacterized protein LOC131020346 isoform X2 [Salvia miltiorrhiza]|nr:uncharacterized protein LOC131020346 isoform X2 [Salvia miltiorrhiza]XP_057805084.1 uncharacterized protein LOC131020346 isoform X2 [Salvia miltiorrhiza]